MAPRDILELMRHPPFRPFRICVTDGLHYDILHPELCMVGKQLVIIGLAADSAEPLVDRTVWVDPLHITRLEPLPGAPAAGQTGNGAGPVAGV